jgi:hypothetical protein
MVTLNKIIVINQLHDNALSGLAISGEGHAPRPRQQPPPQDYSKEILSLHKSMKMIKFIKI